MSWARQKKLTESYLVFEDRDGRAITYGAFNRLMGDYGHDLVTRKIRSTMSFVAYVKLYVGWKLSVRASRRKGGVR